MEIWTFRVNVDPVVISVIVRIEKQAASSPALRLNRLSNTGQYMFKVINSIIPFWEKNIETRIGHNSLN